MTLRTRVARNEIDLRLEFYVDHVQTDEIVPFQLTDRQTDRKRDERNSQFLSLIEALHQNESNGFEMQTPRESHRDDFHSFIHSSIHPFIFYVASRTAGPSFPY